MKSVREPVFLDIIGRLDRLEKPFHAYFDIYRQKSYMDEGSIASKSVHVWTFVDAVELNASRSKIARMTPRHPRCKRCKRKESYEKTRLFSFYHHFLCVAYIMRFTKEFAAVAFLRFSFPRIN